MFKNLQPQSSITSRSSKVGAHHERAFTIVEENALRGAFKSMPIVRKKLAHGRLHGCHVVRLGHGTDAAARLDHHPP